MVGEPMKPATKVFLGFLYKFDGLSTWCSGGDFVEQLPVLAQFVGGQFILFLWIRIHGVGSELGRTYSDRGWARRVRPC